MIKNMQQKGTLTRAGAAALLWLAFCCANANAYLESTVAFDIVTGTPQLFQPEVALLVWPYCQIGVGYAPIPTAIHVGPSSQLPKQTLKASDNVQLNVQEYFDTSFDTLNPFIRIFPLATRNFYVQFMYPMLQAKTTIHMNLSNAANSAQTFPDAFQINLTISQPFPTVSIGHIFASHFFFFNINMGYSYIGDLSFSNASVTGGIPQAHGGADSQNQAQISALLKTTEVQLNNSTRAYRNQIGLLPSINISFGFFL